MINEDILTSLKNAIEKGETLETAIAIAIASGYNQREVQEAAKFIGEGVIEIEKVSREQLLAMPNQKRMLPNILGPRKTTTYILPKIENPTQNITQPLQLQKSILPQQAPRLQQQIRPLPEAKPQQQIRPLPEPQTIKQIKKEIITPQPQRMDPVTPVRIRPPKQSYAKEIILLIILLLLIMTLAVVIAFRNQIITFISG